MHMCHLNTIFCNIVQRVQSDPEVSSKSTTKFGQAMKEIQSDLYRVRRKLKSIIADSTGARGSGAVKRPCDLEMKDFFHSSLISAIWQLPYF
jgi:hypothetical protein